MRVAVCAGLWGRFGLAPPWWASLDRLRAAWGQGGIEVEVVVGGSEAEHREMCEQYAGVWVETPNRPLGRKLNNTVEAAYDRGADYVLSCNADAFLDDALAAGYLAGLLRGDRYTGLGSIYYWELATGRTCLFGYPAGNWRHGEPLGHGRLLHRSLLLNGRPWDEDRDRGLDRSMTQRLRLPRAQLLSVGPAAVAVNVTTTDNIWSFAQMAGAAGARAAEVDPPFLAAIPEWPALRALRQMAAA